MVLSDLPLTPSLGTAHTAAISRWQDDLVLCWDMGAEGRKRVEQNYNWKKELQKRIDFYETLLDA